MAQSPAGTVKSADLYCLSKGNVRGTFDYDTCYNNRPEIQAQARYTRMQDLAIILNNRSPVSGNRSFPVE